MARSALNFLLLSFVFLVDNRVRAIELNFGDVTEILNFSRETITGVLEALEWTRKTTPEDHEYDFPFVKKMERRLINQISVVSRKIDKFEDNMERRTDEILSTILRDLPLRNSLERKLDEMSREIGRVDDIYRNFVDYSKAPEKFESYTMKDFAAACVSNGAGALPDLLKDIHRLAVSSQLDVFDNSVLVLLAQNTKVKIRWYTKFQNDRGDVCGFRKWTKACE